VTSILRGASQEMAEAKAHEIAGMQIELVPVDKRDLELVRQAAVFKAIADYIARLDLTLHLSSDPAAP
jgi:hypothetical protein